MDDEVFAVIGGNHELMRRITADRTAFRFDRKILQPAAFKDSAISVVHRIVGRVELFQRRAKAIGVLHEEFARPQNAEPRTFFVAEFGLNLIQRNRQLTVTADMACHQVGNDFFMSRAKCQVEFAITFFDFEVEQDVAEGFATSRAFKDLDRLQRRHEQFDGSGFVHFLTDNFRHFADRTVSQRQVRVRSGHELSNQPGPQHQLMTGDFGFGRNFFHRRDERLRPAHGGPWGGFRIRDSGADGQLDKTPGGDGILAVH